MEKETKNAHTHNLSLEKTYKNFVSNVQKTSEKIGSILFYLSLIFY